MKDWQIVFLFMIVIAGVMLVSTQEHCDCNDNWSNTTIGDRAPGDRLLFRDINISNRSALIDHRIFFAYSNTNLTSVVISMAPVNILI